MVRILIGRIDAGGDGLCNGESLSSLAYLEDSFIDIEYVLLDKEYIYVNPGNGKLSDSVVLSGRL